MFYRETKALHASNQCSKHYLEQVTQSILQIWSGIKRF